MSAADLALIAAALDHAHYRAGAGIGGAVDAAAHFHEHGWRAGHNPTDWFDCAWYLRRYPDIAAAGIDPFLHYLAHGRAEGRLPDRMAGRIGRILDQVTAPGERRPGYDAPPGAERLTTAALADLLQEAVVAASGFVLAVSHDRYVDVTGGVQVLIGQEQRLFDADRVTYLHVAPAVSRLTLGDDGPALGWLQLVLRGRFVGLVTDAALAAVLHGMRTGLPELRVLVVHSVFGHRPGALVALSQALRPRHHFFWLHDYASLCEGFNLLRNDLEFCHAPPPDSMACRVCVYGGSRTAYLARLGRLFAAMQFHVLAPSRAALDIWLGATTLPWLSARVHENARLVSAAVSPQPSGEGSHRGGEGPVRVAFAGYPLPHKGWPLFLALLQATRGMEAYRFYHFAGESTLPSHDGLVSVPAAVTPAAPDAMVDALAGHRIDLLLVLSPWPETFSYVAHEGLAAGAALVVLEAHGNVSDLVRRHQRGRVLPGAAALLAFFTGTEAVGLARASPGRVGLRLVPSGGTATLDPRALHAADPGASTTGDPALQVSAGPLALRPMATAGEHGQRLRVLLPPGAGPVRISSRRQPPGLATAPAPAGIAVRNLTLDGQAVPHGDARRLAGWHAPDGGVTWTDGDARLRSDGARLLELQLAGGGRYWQAPMLRGDRPREG